MTPDEEYDPQLEITIERDYGLTEQYRVLRQQEALLKNNVALLRMLSQKHLQDLQDSRQTTFSPGETQRTGTTRNRCKKVIRPHVADQREQTLIDSTLKQFPRPFKLPALVQQKATVRNKAEPILRQNDRLVKSNALQSPGDKRAFSEPVVYPSLVHTVPYHLRTSRTSLHNINFRLPKLPLPR